jgi:phospholipid/cholesterol/gamma-HCH transport system permease protein
MSNRMRTERTAEGQISLHLSGPVDRSQVGDLWTEIQELLRAGEPGRLLVDFREVTRIDTAGVVVLRALADLCAGRGIEVTRVNVPEGVEQFLRYASERASGNTDEPSIPRPGPVSRLGSWALGKLVEASVVTRFVGDLTAAAGRTILRPHRLRLREMLWRLQVVGAHATPMVLLLSALMGMIIVFQGIATARNFGATTYVSDVVGIAVTREMAPLLTAVVMAGRSGAAFAAEIGSMRISQQIDALAVMDFDIAEFVVLPRVLALALAGPLLTLLADAAGILGGLITSVMVLDIPVVVFLQHVQNSLGPGDLYTGAIKGATFGALVGLVGCFRGLTTGFAAGSVGEQTTSAVVTGILLIVVADGLFSALFQLFGA